MNLKNLCFFEVVTTSQAVSSSGPGQKPGGRHAQTTRYGDPSHQPQITPPCTCFGAIVVGFRFLLSWPGTPVRGSGSVGANGRGRNARHRAPRPEVRDKPGPAVAIGVPDPEVRPSSPRNGISRGQQSRPECPTDRALRSAVRDPPRSVAVVSEVGHSDLRSGTSRDQRPQWSECPRSSAPGPVRGPGGTSRDQRPRSGFPRSVSPVPRSALYLIQSPAPQSHSPEVVGASVLFGCSICHNIGPLPRCTSPI